MFRRQDIIQLQQTYCYNIIRQYIKQIKNSQLNIMKRLNSQILIDNILSKAPHNKIKNLSNIFYGIPKYLHDNIQVKNQAYLQAFQFKIFCQFVTHPDFRPKFNQYRYQVLKHQITNDLITQSKNQKLKQNIVTRSPTQKKLFTVLNKLGKNKDTYFAYIQAEQTIILMSSEQVQTNKKYLISIYKWITQKQQWYNEQIKKLASELKKTIVIKINEGHQKSEQQLKLQQQLQNIEQKIKTDIENQNKRQNLKVEQVILSYKDKGEKVNKVADKNKQ